MIFSFTWSMRGWGMELADLKTAHSDMPLPLIAATAFTDRIIVVSAVYR